MTRSFRCTVQGAKGETIVDRDEHPRPDATIEKLRQMKPAFATGGTVTAGNASGINDGASAVLVMSSDAATKANARPFARIVSSAVAGVSPEVMGLGPIPASRLALARAGLTMGDMDLIELNEAFASQAIACMRELGADPARVNVNGGAIALGHPLGASGARIVTTLVHEMRRRQRAIRAGDDVHRRRPGHRDDCGAHRRLMARARPMLIGHRGAPRERPENTLPSFLRALELQADGIELDVHCTSDRVVVVHHDEIPRATPPSGRAGGQAHRRAHLR